VIGRQYASIGTPTTFFVTPTGTVKDVWYYAHEEGFDEAMARSIAKAKATPASCTAAETMSGGHLATSVLGPDGKRVELASLIDRPTIVHFWATWCKPCVDELPSLMKFRDDVEKAGTARVVLISTEGDGDAKRIIDFQKSLGLDLRSYRAPKGGLADKIEIAYRLPRTFLVVPGGAVYDNKPGRQNWADRAFAEGMKARIAAAAGPAR
jgi:thiol-disulfide isomerase/thioredoxin